MRGLYDVRDFGALGDGVANDLPAFNATVEAADSAGGGTVWLGPGTFNLATEPWKVGSANGQHHINIIGINRNVTRLIGNPSDGSAMLYLNLEKYITVRDFTLQNIGTKSGIGMQLGGDSGSGTQTNGNLVQHVSFQNFKYGVSTSGGLGTSSEIKFDQCSWQGNDYGFYSANFNGLNYLVELPEIYDNAIAGFYIATGNMTVLGGASKNNGTDFYIAGGNDGQVKIIGFRGEIPTDTWLVAPSGSYLSIEDCIVHPRQAGVEVIRAASDLYLRNCTLNGYITWGGTPQTALELRHVSVNTPGTDWSLNNQYSHANPPIGSYGPGFVLPYASAQDSRIKDVRIYVRDVYEANGGVLYPDVNCHFGFRPDGMYCVLVN